MNELKAVPTDAWGGSAEVRTELRHLCPFVVESDTGSAVISWSVDGTTIELHSLAAYLRSFECTQISHEDLTASVAAALSTHVGGVSVQTSWRTAGLDVELSIGGRRKDADGASATQAPAPAAPPRAGLPVPKMAALRAATEAPKGEQK